MHRKSMLHTIYKPAAIHQHHLLLTPHRVMRLRLAEQGHCGEGRRRGVRREVEGETGAHMSCGWLSTLR